MNPWFCSPKTPFVKNFHAFCVKIPRIFGGVLRIFLAKNWKKAGRRQEGGVAGKD
jgi:hypothetical protein